MDTSFTFPPKAVAAVPYVAEQEPVKDTKVPVVQSSDGAATLPANKPFVAQVVNARLSGTEYPEKPSEIAPTDRTLRPYDTPMLPSNGVAPEESDTSAASDEANAVVDA